MEFYLIYNKKYVILDHVIFFLYNFFPSFLPKVAPHYNIINNFRKYRQL